MGLLDTVLGSATGQKDYKDFLGRYQQGNPDEGYSDQEVLDRYQQVAPNLGPDEYQRAAEQSFTRLSPQDRSRFGQYLGQQGVAGFGGGSPAQSQDPGLLAQMLSRTQQQQPGLLSGLLGGGGGGGGGGGALGNPLARAVLAGIAASAVSRAMGGGGGGALGGMLAGGALGKVLGGGGSGARLSGPAYRVRNLASRKVLANPQGSRDNGTQVIQWDDTGGPEQRWHVEQGPDGYTRFVNGASGKYLANPQGSRENGTVMIQWDATGDADQAWHLEQGAHGGVRIRNVASRLLLANPQGSRDNGTTIIQWQDDQGPEQEWLVEPA